METDSFKDDWELNFESKSDDSFNESVTMNRVVSNSQSCGQLKSSSKSFFEYEVKGCAHSVNEDPSLNNLSVDSFDVEFYTHVSSPDVKSTSVSHQMTYISDSNIEQFSSTRDGLNGASKLNINGSFLSGNSRIFNEDILRNDVDNLRTILQAAVVNKTFSTSDVERAVAICSKTAYFDHIGSVLSGGLRRIIIDPNDVGKQVLTSIFRLVAQISIRCYLIGYDLPFSVVQKEVDWSKYSSEVYVRARSCLLIQSLLSASTEEDEVYEAEEFDEEFSSECGCFPPSVVRQWAISLCQRRLDKAPAVRSAAVCAISHLPPISEYRDHKGRQFQPNNLILSSLRDITAEVRLSAVNSLAIVSDSIINKCLTFLETDEDDMVRRFMAARLISAVHIRSFTYDQRLRFLHLLESDSSSVIRLMISQVLIPRWLVNCEVETLSIMSANYGTENLPLLPFPFFLLEYLDPLADEEFVKKIIVLALMNYMDSAVGNRTDVLAFFTHIFEITEEDRERKAILQASSIEREIKSYNIKSLYKRLFFHRCLVDLFHSLCRCDSLLAERDKIITRLLPNMLKMAEILKVYSSRILDKVGDHHVEEFCIRQLCQMIRLLDRSCNFGLQSWRDTLYYLAVSSSIHPSLEMVDFAVNEVLQEVVRKHDMYEETSTWACYAIMDLLRGTCDGDDSVNEDLPQFEPDDNVLQRCGTILHAILGCPAIDKYTALHRNAFDNIIQPLSLSPSLHGRSLACRLIGLSSTLDKRTMNQRVVMLRHTIELDVPAVQVVAMIALADVICKYGFSEVAKWTFPEEGHSTYNKTILLAEIIQKTIDSDSIHLPIAAFHSLRIMYMQCINWPELLGRLLLKLFENSSNNELESVMNGFLVGFVKRGLAAKIQLVVAYLWCIDWIQTTEKESIEVSVTSLTSYVCRLLTNTIGKKINIKTKEEENYKYEKTNVETQDVCPALLLSIGVLRRIARLPNGIVARPLLISLSGIDVENISLKHISSLLSYSRRVIWILKKEGLEKLISPIKRFGNTLEKRMRKSEKSHHRLKRVKDEDLDSINTNKASSSKRICLGKDGRSKYGINGLLPNRMIIKEEFGGILDAESLKITDSDQDVYTIESDDSSVEICYPKPPIARCSRRSVVKRLNKQKKQMKSVIEQVN